MSKKFKVKAVFLCFLICLCAVFGFAPKIILKADAESSNVSIYYALLSLGYSDIKDKDSLVIEEYIGVELSIKNITDANNTILINKVYEELKSYKSQIDTLINLTNLSASIITTDAQIKNNFIFVKVRYLNLPAYYVFNGRVVPDENTIIKPYDSMEKHLFFNKYNIILGNPFKTIDATNIQERGGQTTLNWFIDKNYSNVITFVNSFTTKYKVKYVFDYSASDGRLYGSYLRKYNITGVNSNTIYVYEFVFNENIPDTSTLFFITFNQYMWYVVAIVVTLIVIGVLYMIVFIKGRREKKNIIETQNNSQNDENLLNTCEE